MEGLNPMMTHFRSGLRCAAASLLALQLASPLCGAELLGHWKLDEGMGDVAKDSAGGHDGAVIGAKWSDGKDGRALDFNGKNGAVEIADGAKSCFALKEFTISAWILPRSYPKNEQPVWWAGIAGRKFHTESSYGIRLFGDHKLQLCVYGENGGNSSLFGKTTVALGKWHHVVSTYGANGCRLYVDGRLDATGEARIAPVDHAEPILIGAGSRAGRCFDGLIKDVKIFKGALSVVEVEDEFLRGAKDGAGSSLVTFDAAQVEEAPPMDGNLDTPCWRKAKKLSLVDAETGGRPAAPTEVYVCYDKDNLYFGFLCHEPLMGKLKARESKRDGKVWEDDCVEIFLDPDLSRSSYHHFIVNALGTQYDEKMRTSDEQDGFWDGDWRCAVRKGDDFWSATVAIPFSDLALGKGAGDVWGVNFCRERKASPGNSLLSMTYSNFNVPERFATMKNVKAALDDYKLGVPSPALEYSFNDGKVQLSAIESVLNTSAAPRDIEVRLECLNTGDKASTRLALAPGESKEWKTPIAADKRGDDYRFLIEIRDAQSKKLSHRSIRSANIPPLVSTYFDRSYYTSERKAKFIGRVNAGNALPGGMAAAISLENPSGMPLEASTAIEGLTFSMELGIAQLPAGDANALFTLKWNGEAIFSQRTALRKLPSAPFEIKVDQENLVPLVNGKPFFPMGIMDIPECKIEEYAKAGFNITTGPSAGNFLDTAFNNGMMVVISTYQHSAPRSFFKTKPLDELEKIIRQGPLAPRLKSARNHPAFFGVFWDEPGTAEAAGCGVESKVTREADPHHLIWPCFWQTDRPPFPSAFNGIYDILGHDPYWLPLKGERISKHAAQVDTYRRFSLQLGKPLWITPQAAGWEATSEITLEQQRCQTYLDMIHGAKGIVYWTYSIASTDMLKTLKELAGEVRYLTPALLAPDGEQLVDDAGNSGVHVSVKEFGGKTWLLAANIDGDMRKRVRISLPGIQGEPQALALFENRRMPLRKGAFEDEFAPYGTHAYEIAQASGRSPLAVKLELLSSERTSLKLVEAGKPEGVIGNPSFEMMDKSGRPLYWCSSTNWEYPANCAIDSAASCDGGRSLRLSLPSPTLYAKTPGYGWTAKGARDFDLGGADPLLRHGHYVESNVFRADLPDGPCKVSAIMRPPRELYLLAGDVKRSLSPLIMERPGSSGVFKDYDKRIREYSFDVTVVDGSLKFGIVDGSIFSLSVKPANGDGKELRFKFGPMQSARLEGFTMVEAPQFTRVSAWTEEGSPKVKGDASYTVSLNMKGDRPGCPVQMRFIDLNWGTKNPEPSTCKVEVGEEWKPYSFKIKIPEGIGRIRIFVESTQGATVWVDKVEFKEESL